MKFIFHNLIKLQGGALNHSSKLNLYEYSHQISKCLLRQSENEKLCAATSKLVRDIITIFLSDVLFDAACAIGYVIELSSGCIDHPCSLITATTNNT